MKRRGLLVLLSILTVCLGITLSGCSKYDYKVGVCQLVQHSALDQATNGFIEALQEEMNKAGKSLKLDVQIASGDSTICTTIVSKFKARRYDLIMANATPALQAASNATDIIPILGTSITTYNAALNIEVDRNGATGLNISGTSDLADLASQASVIKEWCPNCSKVGIVFCSGEANSRYQVDIIKEKFEDLGIEAREFAFTDSNDILAVCESASLFADCIYIPTDNTAASNTGIIDQVFSRNNIPVFAGDAELCKTCAVASFSISYYEIGYKTGLMAARILLEEEDVKTMPIEYDTNPKKVYSATIASALGLTVPLGFERIDE